MSGARLAELGQHGWPAFGATAGELAAIELGAQLLVGRTFAYRDGAAEFSVTGLADARPVSEHHQNVGARGAVVVVGTYRYTDGRTYGAGPYVDASAWSNDLGIELGP